MKQTLMYAALVLAYALAATGCNKSEETAAPGANTAEQTAPATQAVQQKEIRMVAKINGTEITSADVDLEVNNIMAQYQQNMPPEQLQMMRPNLVKQATENLINRHVLFQEADRQNIKPTPEEIDAEMNVIIGRFPSPAVFEQKLSQMGFTREKIIRDIEQQLKITALVKKSQADLNISITDPEVAAFYKDNPDNFKTPEQVRASHILMKMEAEDTEEIKKEKHHKLTELRSQIQGGADFAKLAQDNSDCPSKQQGGDLGFFERGKMVKPFADTAFTLKAGELSDIIETQFGYHLIKVAEHKAAGTTSLDEAKQKISDYLKLSKEQEAFQKYLSTLREATTVEYAETGAS